MSKIKGNANLKTNRKQAALMSQISVSATSACLSLLLLSACSGTPSSAQPSPQLEKLKVELDLSQDQANAVDQILTAAMRERNDIKASASATYGRASRDQLKSVTAKADGQLIEVLTEAQFNQYIALREQILREALRERVYQTQRTQQ